MSGYFFRPPFFLPWLYPALTWRVPTDSKELYITFDDGPVAGPTEFALGELVRARAKATFFCIGDNINKNPSVFQKILLDGHAIGNHTFNHMNGWENSSHEYLDDVTMCTKEIARHATEFSSGIRLFRPPFGRITRRQIGDLKDYKVIMWDVLTNDYTKNLSPEDCLRGSLAATRPGSIIVFHDSYKAEKKLTYVLPRYLDHFGGLGYSFKILS